MFVTRQQSKRSGGTCVPPTFGELVHYHHQWVMVGSQTTKVEVTLPLRRDPPSCNSTKARPLPNLPLKRPGDSV